MYQLHYQAFGNRKDESELVIRIRNSKEFISELSLVAEEDNKIIGHILLSKAAVHNEETTSGVIVLAPIAVNPNWQKQGIGSKLMIEGLKRCKEEGHQLVFLIGHPSYYPKFGFIQLESSGMN